VNWLTFKKTECEKKFENEMVKKLLFSITFQVLNPFNALRSVKRIHINKKSFLIIQIE